MKEMTKHVDEGFLPCLYIYLYMDHCSFLSVLVSPLVVALAGGSFLSSCTNLCIDMSTPFNMHIAYAQINVPFYARPQSKLDAHQNEEVRIAFR
jgi:hypothetical protein